MTNKINAVLFDLVGTLIYIKDPVGYVYSNVARSFGFETDYMKLDEACRGLLQQVPVDGGVNEKQWWREIVFKTFNLCGYDLKNKFDDVFEELFKIFSQKSAWVIYPDVIKTLETCYGKSLRTGLISNFDNRVEIILEELNLKKYFNCLAYSGKVGFSKPDPKIFQYALKELNSLPEETLYVGDSLNIDYYPTYDLGINSLLIDREKICKTKNVRIISDLSQIFDFVSNKIY